MKLPIYLTGMKTFWHFISFSSFYMSHITHIGYIIWSIWYCPYAKPFKFKLLALCRTLLELQRKICPLLLNLIVRFVYMSLALLILQKKTRFEKRLSSWQFEINYWSDLIGSTIWYDIISLKWCVVYLTLSHLMLLKTL